MSEKWEIFILILRASDLSSSSALSRMYATMNVHWSSASINVAIVTLSGIKLLILGILTYPTGIIRPMLGLDVELRLARALA